MKWYISTRARLGLALGTASIVSIMLFLLAAWRNHSWEFDYLNWNLFLAWLPLALMLWLEKVLRRKLWSSWQALGLTALFVGFLPNAFYLITDVIHLQDAPRVDPVFDAIMFGSFILDAFMIGLICLHLFHIELRRRLSVVKSWSLLVGLILLASFAIYIGRDLRWNTWDIVFNSASVLFEVSDQLLAPAAHPDMFTTTFGFFLLITSTYVASWYMARAARQQKISD